MLVLVFRSKESGIYIREADLHAGLFSDLVAPGKIIDLTAGYRSPEHR